MSEAVPARYSSSVQLELEVGVLKYPLSQICRDSVLLKSPLELPPSLANVVMHIDGQKTVWPVRMTNGAVPYCCEVEIEDL